MPTIMFNGELFGDGCTTRLIDDVMDENYGWVQYLDVNGEWQNWRLAIVPTVDLFVDGANNANFAKFSGGSTGYEAKNDGTLSLSPTISIKQYGNNVNISSVKEMCLMSDAYDLTNYNTLRLEHTSSTDWGYAHINDVCVTIVAEKGTSMTSVARVWLLNGAKSTSTAINLDVSSLTGNHYILIEVMANGPNYAQTSINYMRLIR